MFTRLSRETAESGKLYVDGVFITQYLPFAPENYVKVYLCGLCAAQGIADAQTPEKLAVLAGTDAETVSKAFAYWEENGLIATKSGEESYVEYLPVVPLSKQIRKYSKEKFRGFNDQLHALLPDRNFLPNEYNEYYYLMDTLRIEVEAMLMIIGYCKQIKGDKIHTSYILAVARKFAEEGCLTYESVSEKINEYDFQYRDLTAVLKALKLKRKSEPEDSRLYGKWTKTFGFKSETIIHVAKNIIKRGGMEGLDRVLSKYYELRLSDADAIDEYEIKRKKQYELMGEILHRLGLNYDRLDSVIENYLLKWQSLGFTDDTLVTIATYCLTANMRTLESMNGAVTGFHRKGLLSAADIDAFATLGRDVGDLLTAHGVVCAMDVGERNTFYKWKRQWNMSDEMIALAADKAAGKKYAVSYADSILAKWFDAGLKTAEEAERASSFSSPSQPTRTYSAEELEAMFKKLDDDKKLDAAADLKKKLMDTDSAFYENERALRLANIAIARGEDVDLTAIMKEREKILAAHGLTEADLDPDKA